jgi:hypothetical protein
MENRYPHDGFNVNTDDVYFDLPFNYTLDDLCELFEEKIILY